MNRIRKSALKSLGVILALSFVLFAFTGCPGGGIVFGVHPNLPWGGDAALITEIKTFDIIVWCSQTPSDADGNLTRLAEGELVQTLTGCDGSSYGSLCNHSTRGYHLHITTRQELRWNNHENAGANRNLTDVLYSSVSFERASLRPLTSTRHLMAQTRPEYDGNPAFNNSQLIKTNYEHYARVIDGVEVPARTSLVQVRRNLANTAWLNTTPQAQSLPDTVLFSNEQLHYLIRGLQAVNPGSGISVPTFNAVENYIRFERATTNSQRRNAVTTTGITFNTGGVGSAVNIADYYYTVGEGDDAESVYFLQNLLDYGYQRVARMDEETNQPIEGEYSTIIPIMPVTMNLAADPAGPSHNFILTAPNVRFANGQIHTSRLILGYFYSMYNIYGTRIFQFSYTLSNYSVE